MALNEMLLDLPKEQFDQLGMSLIDSVILTTKEETLSKSAARRKIESGAIRINDVKITDPTVRICVMFGIATILKRKE